MMIDLVVRQLGRHKTRTVLTVLGVAIGILLVTTLSSFSEGIKTSVNTELSYLSGLVTVTSEGVTFENFIQSELDEDMLSELEDLSGVERVSSFVTGTVPSVGDIYGANINDLDMFNLDVEPKEGRWIDEDTAEVVLGFVYAENSGLSVGDEITIRDKKYEIVGVIEETGSIEDEGIMTSLETAQKILLKDDKVSIIMVKPEDPDDTEELASEIKNKYSDVQALSEKDAAREAEKFTGQLGVMTFALGSIAAIIAALGIMNVMFMSVRERRKEIGAMKALGATTYEVLSQIIFEALVMTLIGAAIGILLSFVAVSVLNNLAGTTIASITFNLLVQVTFFSAFLGALSGLLPAREAAKLQPAVVLRYE